jgi:hypothetical protein
MRGEESLLVYNMRSNGEDLPGISILLSQRRGRLSIGVLSDGKRGGQALVDVVVRSQPVSLW